MLLIVSLIQKLLRRNTNKPQVEEGCSQNTQIVGYSERQEETNQILPLVRDSDSTNASAKNIENQTSKQQWQEHQLTQSQIENLQSISMLYPNQIQTKILQTLKKNPSQTVVVSGAQNCGKTAAVLLHALRSTDIKQRVQTESINITQVLILTAKKERTQTIIRRLQQIERKAAILTQTGLKKQDIHIVTQGAHIVVCTPKEASTAVFENKTLLIPKLRILLIDHLDDIFQQFTVHQQQQKLIKLVSLIVSNACPQTIITTRQNILQTGLQSENQQKCQEFLFSVFKKFFLYSLEAQTEDISGVKQDAEGLKFKGVVGTRKFIKTTRCIWQVEGESEEEFVEYQ